MITIRKAEDRGRTKLGWLDSWHSFSFGRYIDREFTSFGALRVINDDIVAPGAGFGTHPHDNMEIITYPLDGAVEHRDSTGGGGVLRHGDVQVMSAGSGLTHSEFNHSKGEPLRLLQIWIIPTERDAEPRYEDLHIGPDNLRNSLTPIASGDAREGALPLRADASVSACILDENASVSHEIAPGRRAWVQVARGSVSVNGAELGEGDGAAITDETDLTVSSPSGAEFLLFDLA